jgi:hypothetical protein
MALFRKKISETTIKQNTTAHNRTVYAKRHTAFWATPERYAQYFWNLLENMTYDIDKNEFIKYIVN